jgi:hypothetical protein
MQAAQPIDAILQQPFNYSGMVSRVDPGQQRQHFSDVVIESHQNGSVRVQPRHQDDARKQLVQEVTEGQGICTVYAVDDDVVVNDARIRRAQPRRAYANDVLEMRVRSENSAAEVACIVVDVPDAAVTVTAHVRAKQQREHARVGYFKHTRVVRQHQMR